MFNHGYYVISPINLRIIIVLLRAVIMPVIYNQQALWHSPFALPKSPTLSLIIINIRHAFMDVFVSYQPAFPPF